MLTKVMRIQFNKEAMKRLFRYTLVGGLLGFGFSFVYIYIGST